MTRLHVEAEGVTRAGPEVVWPLVADVTRYAEWGPWDESGYERPGDGSEHGSGAVRRIRYRRTTSVEQVLDVEDGRRIAYTVLKGIPVRNDRAEVVLTPTVEGTRVELVRRMGRDPARSHRAPKAPHVLSRRGGRSGGGLGPGGSCRVAGIARASLAVGQPGECPSAWAPGASPPIILSMGMPPVRTNR